MHIQIVTFNLQDLRAADYRTICDGLADVIAKVPGLISKAWLVDELTNTYGGVYTWVDRAAMEAYLDSDIFKAVAANPNFTNVQSRDFEVLERPTRVTRALLAAAA